MTIPKQLIFFVSLMSIDSGVYAMDATPAPALAPASAKPFDPAPLIAFLQDNKKNFEVGQSNFPEELSAFRERRQALADAIKQDLLNAGQNFNGEMPLTTKAIGQFADQNFFIWRAIYCPPNAQPGQAQIEQVPSCKQQ